MVAARGVEGLGSPVARGAANSCVAVCGLKMGVQTELAGVPGKTVPGVSAKVKR